LAGSLGVLTNFCIGRLAAVLASVEPVCTVANDDETNHQEHAANESTAIKATTGCWGRRRWRRASIVEETTRQIVDRPAHFEVGAPATASHLIARATSFASEHTTIVLATVKVSAVLVHSVLMTRWWVGRITPSATRTCIAHVAIRMSVAIRT